MSLCIRQAIKATITRTPLPQIVCRSRVRGNLTIFAYHRIAPPPGADYPFDDQLFSCTPEEFARELLWFKRHLDVISVKELFDGLHADRKLPKRPALITFDDGYRDNYEIAYPLLREEGLAACFFLCTRFVGSRTVPWWDAVACCIKHSRADLVKLPVNGQSLSLSTEDAVTATREVLQLIKRMPWTGALTLINEVREQTGVDPSEYVQKRRFLTWDNAREMRDGEMDLGGHTRTHPLLGQIQDQSLLREEVRGCQNDLTRELGSPAPAFAYPVGSATAISAAAQQEVEGAGFKGGFSYVNRLASRRGDSRWAIPRIHTEYGDDFASFLIGMMRLSN